jgi:hypothetical protein
MPPHLVFWGLSQKSFTQAIKSSQRMSYKKNHRNEEKSQTNKKTNKMVLPFREAPFYIGDDGSLGLLILIVI